MGRRPTTDPTVRVTINHTVVGIGQSVMTLLPDVIPFVEYLVTRPRPISLPTALRYARVVAGAKRSGRWMTPDLVPDILTRTAINAYWRWVGEHYEARVVKVTRTIINSDLRNGAGRLRIGSLVPPSRTSPKQLPMWVPQFIPLNPDGSRDLTADAAKLVWYPSMKWTLHVPPRDDVPAHEDPCENCVPIEITEEQLRVVADAFYDAWGPRDPTTLPPECFLFGQPPLTSRFGPMRPAYPVGRFVGLLPDGPIADHVEHLNGVVARDIGGFLDRLREKTVDTIVLSNTVVGDQFPGLIEMIASELERIRATRFGASTPTNGLTNGSPESTMQPWPNDPSAL